MAQGATPFGFEGDFAVGEGFSCSRFAKMLQVKGNDVSRPTQDVRVQADVRAVEVKPSDITGERNARFWSDDKEVLVEAVNAFG